MKLTGQRVQRICDALSYAYPTRDTLRMLLRLELDENLEEIAGGENHSVVVFNLVTWAERSGRINELITRAQRRMPGNLALQQLASEWRTQAAAGHCRAVEIAIGGQRGEHRPCFHRPVPQLQPQGWRGHARGAGRAA